MVEWHDLPVERIAITERGLTIDVRAFDDDADRYEQATLLLLDADAIEFDVQGKLSLKDLGSLEITDFDVAESSPGRVTGSLGSYSAGPDTGLSSHQCALAAGAATPSHASADP